MIAFKNTLIINLKTGLIVGISEDHCYVALWLEVVAVVGVGRRIRPVKVGKTWVGNSGLKSSNLKFSGSSKLGMLQRYASGMRVV